MICFEIKIWANELISEGLSAIKRHFQKQCNLALIIFCLFVSVSYLTVSTPSFEKSTNANTCVLSLNQQELARHTIRTCYFFSTPTKGPCGETMDLSSRQLDTEKRTLSNRLTSVWCCGFQRRTSKTLFHCSKGRGKQNPCTCIHFKDTGLRLILRLLGVYRESGSVGWNGKSPSLRQQCWQCKKTNMNRNNKDKHTSECWGQHKMSIPRFLLLALSITFVCLTT